MMIPEQVKTAILFAFERRGIVPVHVQADLIVFDVQFASGLALAGVITATHRRAMFRTKPVIALAVLSPEKESEAACTEHVDLPTGLDLAFGTQCASRLLGMMRAVADVKKAG